MEEHAAYYLAYLLTESSLSVSFSHKSSFRRSHGGGRLFAFYLYHVETLYDIADLDVVIVFYADTAFISLVDFFDIVFEPPQR